MSKKGLKRTLKFDISNHYCVHYEEPCGCNKDDEFHTCCGEECTLSEILWKRRTDCDTCKDEGFTVDSEGHAHKCYECPTPPKFVGGDSGGL
ncbi:MAG: hypothetical protein ACTSPB_00560 [Candidatus Thorarchaeota archaeon]